MIDSPTEPTLGRFPRLENRSATIGLTLTAVAACVATVACWTEPRLVFLATGLWALAILLIPVAADRNYEAVSVWSSVGLTVIIGVTLRGASLTFRYPDGERLDTLYFLGHEPHEFFYPAVLLIVGLLMLSLGYLRRKPQPSLTVVPFSRSDQSLLLVCIALLSVSVVATALYLRATGSADGNWSGKREVIPDLDLAGSGYESHGILRFLASLAIFGHLLAVAEALSSKKHRPFWWTTAGIFLLVASVAPFHASLRTTVAWQFLMPAAMIIAARRRRALPILIGFGIVVVLSLFVLTTMRSASDDRDAGWDSPTAARLFDAVVLNRNQIDLPKTAHIVRAVPSELPLQYGATIARWALAPIPRRLWPDKPVIPPGPVVGHTLYDQHVAGVPPSLVAEWYWNFGWPGVILGCFGFGVLLRAVQHRFGTGISRDPFRSALFVAGPMILGFEAVGSSLGSGLFRAGLHTAVMAALLFLIRVRKD
ncbi:MAG: oligosaccharide repeat unit polymerase [Verrucomicrobiae bacterium]|nr:oligosaccharide repeat unit polymerase [Verrucomicrobiae bacterium]